MNPQPDQSGGGAREQAIENLVAREFASECDFLAALVKTPTDNPPGDCQAHAQVARELLEGLGFEVEMHAPPGATVQASGMISATNIIVRQRFGGTSARHL